MELGYEVGVSVLAVVQRLPQLQSTIITKAPQKCIIVQVEALLHDDIRFLLCGMS